MSFFSTPTKAAPAARKALPTVANCRACGLDKTCRSPKMPVDGAGRRKIMIVGEAPGEVEDRQGRPFVGPSGDVIWPILRRFGVGRDDCWVTNSARCHPPGNAYPEGTVDHCRPYLVQAIRELEPEVVILLGGKAVLSLVRWLWKDDVDSIYRWAGWRIPAQKINAWVCPTFHPAAMLHDEKDGRRDEGAVKRLLFERHLKAACRLSGRPWDPVPDYRSKVEVVVDPDEAAKIIDGFTEAGGSIAFDYETTTLRPHGPHAEIYCCAVCHNGERTVAYPWHGAAVDATARLLRSPTKKRGQNMSFEHRWTMAKLGFWIPGETWEFDDMIAAHVIDNRPGITSIKFQAFALLGQDGYDEEIKPYLRSPDGKPDSPNRIREAPLEKVLLYCGMDALLEWEVSIRQAVRLGLKLEV